MTPKEAQLLVKILNMTLSENDHEALIAIRKANAMLKKHGNNWSDMYKPRVTGWEQYQVHFV